MSELLELVWSLPFDMVTNGALHSDVWVCGGSLVPTWGVVQAGTPQTALTLSDLGLTPALLGLSSLLGSAQMFTWVLPALELALAVF